MAFERGSRWRLLGWGGAAAVLAVAAVAMQFTNEVAWTGADFVVAAGMLAFVGIGLELSFRASANRAFRLGAATGLTAAFLLFWSAGAVGVIGPETDPANLLYLGVIAIAVIGSLAALFRPRGASLAMAAAAVVQAAIGVVAIALGWGTEDPLWPLDVAGATIAFTTMWALSAWLFHRSGKQPATA